MTGGKISEGELKAGQIVTVLEWKEEMLPPPQPNPMEILTGKSSCGQQSSRCSHLLGHVLEILAVDLPYFIVKDYSMADRVVTMDTRELVLKELTPEYVEAAQKAIAEMKRQAEEELRKRGGGGLPPPSSLPPSLSSRLV